MKQMKLIKQAITIFCISVVVTSTAIGQDDKKGYAEKQDNFTKIRKDDFTKLIGGIQEGAKLNYNSEKTNLEGSGGAEIKKAHLFIQGTGSIGTTTNLSSLFSQKALPTFSGSITTHWMIPGLSTWFYDGSFKDNFSQIQGSTYVDRLSTITARGQNVAFHYREAIQDRIAKGELKSTDNLYTFKRFFWISLEGKYENSKYSFYDASQTFSNQLSEPVYNSWTGKFNFNGYLFWNKTDIKWHGLGWRPNFVYFNIAAKYGLGNNIQQLKKTTVNDIITTSVDGLSTRQTVKSQSAYNGTYKEFKTFTPSFELIISPVRSFAIDVFGEHNIIAKADRDKYGMSNFGSLATGIYFYGEGNSKINIGAFYKWTKDTQANTWVQQIGLKTTIPITPL